MKYFKNTELAKLYHVSEKSVRNWIEAAQDGKFDLQFFSKNGRNYIANTSKNTLVIEKLVEKGRKFKNTRGHKTVTPLPKFYESFSSKDIDEIITHVTNYHEIPLKYSYSDGGASQWNDYAQRLSDEQTPNILNQTVELLANSLPYLDQATTGHKVNIVDLGPGNGIPVRALLEHFVSTGKLNRYIAIDASQEMLSIVEKNIGNWFGNKVKFEGYVRDFSHERFDDILSLDYKNNKKIPVNIVALLGGTLDNLKMPSHALRTINASLRGVNDLLLYSGYPDTYKARRYFDFAPQPNQKLRVELFFELLGLNDSHYHYEFSFDEQQYARYGYLRPKLDLSIGFDLGDNARQLELKKDEPILAWRYQHRNTVETMALFNDSDFDIVLFLKSLAGQFTLLVSKIKTGIN